MSFIILKSDVFSRPVPSVEDVLALKRINPTPIMVSAAARALGIAWTMVEERCRFLFGRRTVTVKHVLEAPGRVAVLGPWRPALELRHIVHWDRQASPEANGRPGVFLRIGQVEESLYADHDGTTWLAAPGVYQVEIDDVGLDPAMIGQGAEAVRRIASLIMDDGYFADWHRYGLDVLLAEYMPRHVELVG